MSGDVYLVKKAFPKEWVENIKKKVRLFFKQSLPSFHKTYENCPDFHRLIDEEISKNYAVDVVKHAAYFFPWNGDPLNLFEDVWRRWSLYKIISGFSADQYVKNTPKDGVIDRIQICLYPSGGGGLKTHADPYENQRIFIATYLSKRGEDYQKGGFYSIDHNNHQVDLESKIEVGDMGFAYATVVHGVDPIDPNEKKEFENSKKGRWFMSLHSMDSDEKGDQRRTAQRINLSESQLSSASTY